MRKDSKITGGNPKTALQQDIEIQGIYSFPNQYSQVPQGGLAESSNCVIDSPGTVESRRGNKQYGTYAVGDPLQTLSITEYQNTLITHDSDGQICKDVATVMTPFAGSYTVPITSNVESRVRFISLNKNLYFTSGAGVYRLDSLANNPVLAGAPAALGGTGATTGASGFLANNVSVAYRLLWVYIDANNNLIRGAPSDRVIVSNSTGGTVNTLTTWTVPVDITTGWTYQLYRSNESANLTSEPDDNMQLVYQGIPTAGEISSRQLAITDITPSSLKGEVLYTSAEGIQAANTRPPFANDIALYKGLTCYANCTSKHTFFLTLISGSLLQSGDTLTFSRVSGGSFVLTAGAAENVATGTFKLTTGGTPAQNIASTASSIVRVANLFASNTWLDAYYSSGYTEAPGKMTFIERNLNTTGFSVTCSRTGNIFNPTLPSSGRTPNNTSTNSSLPNAVYLSKSQQPDAVPVANYIAVGTSSAPIVRVLSLRDSLIVIKTDGIYRITGTAFSNFAVQPLDVQMQIKSANSAVVLNNMVYCFVDQGVVRIQDSGGIEIVSLPIERELLELATSNYPGFAGATFGIAYPSDHKYILYTVTTKTDTYATRAFVYNYVTNAWTMWTTSFTAGFVRSSNNLLYQATYNASGSQIYEERKTFTFDDYADEQYPVTITSSSGRTVNFVGAIPVVGQTLEQVQPIGTLRAQVLAINGSTLTVDLDMPWLAGAATLYNPINVTWQISNMYGDTPNAMKQFPEISLLLDVNSFGSLNITFSSDQSTGFYIATNVNQLTTGGWGEFQWGLGPWGSVYLDTQRIRVFVPAPAQKGNWLTMVMSLKQAFKRMRCSGITVAFRSLTVRQR